MLRRRRTRLPGSPAGPSRRALLRAAAAGSAGLAVTGSAGLAAWLVLDGMAAVPGAARVGPAVPARRGQPGSGHELTAGWRFGRWVPGAGEAGFDDSALPLVNLPHSLTRLSWDGWDPAGWEGNWLYRRHFTLPPSARGMRVFLDFDGAMTVAAPWLNGTPLPPHLGGYLPFGYEITGLARPGDNVLAVALDNGWALDVPPQGAPGGPGRIDFYQPGGLYRPVRLRVVPQAFIADVHAKPVDVLSPSRGLEVACTVDAAAAVSGRAHLDVTLSRDGRMVARAGQAVHPAAGQDTATVMLSPLPGVRLWDVDAPVLYDVSATLSVNGRRVHRCRVRTGFRDARFERDGFFLNGRRLQLFGLSRHQLYPFAGVAQPARVQRRDAEILRRELNCNMVRCSHYPQDDAFLDACDELGLLVWEELPGWHYIGGPAWQDAAVRDVSEMVRRDRSRPSVIIWGVRVNECAVDDETSALCARAARAAKRLDGARPTSGATRVHSRDGWEQDVFAFNDYTRGPGGTVALQPPVPGLPYLITEAVGQYDYLRGTGYTQAYRRTSPAALQARQAALHAQAHELAAAGDRYSGALGWCAFDYASGISTSENGLKYPGVCDTFRVPKLGASVYQAQADPRQRPVIAPAFYWDSGPDSASAGPGAMICSNCDRLEVYIGGAHRATVTPDAARFGHLRYPPSFADLTTGGSPPPDLRIDGYLGGQLVITRWFSADTSKDRLAVAADDPQITADGSDATRVAFAVTDRYGAARRYQGADVTISVTGPGLLLGDSPFPLGRTGGTGAVWIRAREPGRITVTVAHPALGARQATIEAVAPV